LDGSNGIMLRDFREVNFKIDESLVGTLEEVFYVFIVLDIFFQTGNCRVDLMFVKFDQGNAFLFYSIL
jgi:hypothetical protein